MNSFRDRLGHHWMSVACAIAAVLIVGAFAFDIAPLAILAVLFCGTMMIGMVWMMFSMAGKGHH